jgi:hypothetical protein
MALAVCTLTLAVLGCHRPRVAERRECPHDWNWDSLRTGRHWEPFTLATDAAGNKQLAIPDAIQNIPEFHDCQRFIVGDSTTKQLRYDSLFAIFASFRLDSLFRDTSPAPLRREPVSTPSASAQPVAIPTAEIYAEGSYAPLGIKPQLNCLFLTRQGSAWRAKMVPVGGDDARCRSTSAFPDITGTDLEVRPVMVAGLSDADYPPVARWDWDERKAQQYIGIKCGAAWCEVGAPGFVPSPAHPERVTDGMPPGERRIYEVKGWYDEQYLAVRAGTRTVPSSILGTVFPDQRLGEYDDQSFTPAATPGAPKPWLPGAAAMLRGGTPTELDAYRRKLDFKPSSATGPLNPIGLCFGSRQQCAVPAAVSGTGQWWARIGASGGKHVSVTRCNLTIDPPGTARWRWSVKDEGVWMRCAKGCCEVIGLQ